MSERKIACQNVISAHMLGALSDEARRDYIDTILTHMQAECANMIRDAGGRVVDRGKLTLQFECVAEVSSE